MMFLHPLFVFQLQQHKILMLPSGNSNHSFFPCCIRIYFFHYSRPRPRHTHTRLNKRTWFAQAKKEAHRNNCKWSHPSSIVTKNNNHPSHHHKHLDVECVVHKKNYTKKFLFDVARSWFCIHDFRCFDVDVFLRRTWGMNARTSEGIVNNIYSTWEDSRRMSYFHLFLRQTPKICLKPQIRLG